MSDAKDAKKVMYSVFDMNQRGEKGRKHDIITKFYPKDLSGHQPEPETQTYELFSEKPCEMTMEHAMKFLVAPEFKVLKPDGTRIMWVTKMDLSRPLTALKDDELVVSYSELSRDALFRRVKVLPGSEEIKEGAKHQELVDFMVAWRASLKGMTEGDRVLAEKMAGPGLDGAMTGDMLNKMFDKSPMVAHQSA